MKWALVSAEGSTRHRAKVSRGNRGGSIRRACKAERREDLCAYEGGGEGRARRMDSVSVAEEEERRRWSTDFALKKSPSLSGSCSGPSIAIGTEAVDCKRP